MGSGKDRVKVKVLNELSYANELNRFYCRFDIFDFKKEQESVKRDHLSKLVRPHLRQLKNNLESYSQAKPWAQIKYLDVF